MSDQMTVTVEVAVNLPRGRTKNGWPRTGDGWTIPSVRKDLLAGLRGELLHGAEDGSAWAWGTFDPGDSFRVVSVKVVPDA